LSRFSSNKITILLYLIKSAGESLRAPILKGSWRGGALDGRHRTRSRVQVLRLSSEERNKTTELLRGRLREESGIVLAYLHEGFLKERPFRDIDIALWIKNEEEA